ncbi:MAG TPA: hypothetical protein VJ863_01170 [Sphaerochaeta sp.]|nr:hypothetical protein [Sphaerochaeta sp.]
MDDLNTLFSEFERQVGEITSHAQQVHKLDFTAKLRNGTYFNFSYNSDTFNRKLSSEGKHPYAPASVFNAVVDILGSLVSSIILVLLAITIHRSAMGFIQPTVLIILSFSLFTSCFILNALYHLFDRTSGARFVFSNVAEALKILSLSFANVALAMLTSPAKASLVLLFTLLVGATAALLLSLGTQGGGRASLAFCILLPYLPLYAETSLALLTTATLFGLWSLVALIAKSNLRIKSNTTFALIGVVSLALNFLPLLS